jgi:putative DNA primase/helicase
VSIATKVASANAVAAVERLARADRRHAATTDQWDNDPWLINGTTGVVDLRTGEVHPHERKDYSTKIAAAGILAEPKPPERWLAFLNDVTDGDKDLQGYLARMAGYMLTGITSEHALFFLYGTGANGKSVFVNTLAAVLGDYATNAPIDTFMETKTDHHPTDVAGLRGARLVTAIEVEKGRRWAEAKIKSLTGGDKICARFMRQDFFEYKPQFKLLIAGNNKPTIREVDEAMKRRLHLIPFTVTIPAHKRDHTLAERLLEERDGILRWALDGCMEWQRIGLKPPASVMSATEEYLEAEDALGRWISEECIENPSAAAPSDELYQSWKTWTEKWGEYAGSMRKFSDDLVKRGFSRSRSNRKRLFQGIALNTTPVQGEIL